MKTRVRVTLVLEREVEIDVLYEEGEDPTDLTREDAHRARSIASVSGGSAANWEIRHVEEAT